MPANLVELFTDPATTGGLSAIITAISVKIIEKLLSKNTAKDDAKELTNIRQELRNQADSLTHALDACKTEANEWRERYWEEVRVNSEISAEVNTLKADNEILQKHLTEALDTMTPVVSGSI